MRNFLKWIFDLDGTLTQNNLDFNKIRNELKIPENVLILEYMQKLPAKEAYELQKKLTILERQMIAGTKVATGANNLLTLLASKNFPMAILTRNTKENAIQTLQQTKLSSYFKIETIIGRTEANPKPSPDGISLILERWQKNNENCVIVGDYILDIECGRNAGIGTIYVNKFDNCDLADFSVNSLSDIVEQLI